MGLEPDEMQCEKAKAPLIFTIKQLIETSRTKNTEVYTAFFVLEKAFDRIHWIVLGKSIGEKNKFENNSTNKKSIHRQHKGGIYTDIIKDMFRKMKQVMAYGTVKY